MTSDFHVPMLSWSVAAANNDLFSADNPRAMVPQILRYGYPSWVWSPGGCLDMATLARAAPRCGMVYDRVLGLQRPEYDIGPYAGEDGRRAACSPVPLAEDGGALIGGTEAAFAGIYSLTKKFAMLAVFVGSPPQYFPEAFDGTDAAKRRSLLNKCATVGAALRLFDRGVVCIFDTGGVASVESDAGAVFRTLWRHGVPFLLEPTRPMNTKADPIIESSCGLVSLRAVHETMEREVAARTRAWYDDDELQKHGRASVVWYTDQDVRARVDGAMARLARGGRVLVALRGLSEGMVRELAAARDKAELASTGGTKIAVGGVAGAGKPDLSIGGG